ncbi:DUF6756 family protein [Bacillus paralicheniformis]|uniref:DUF6756 family protein n=1 Tax=Bacillus paralicheniformis TaxID=1648923 RepID=UPI0035F54332
MWDLKEQILAAAKSVDIKVNELSTNDTEIIFHNLANKYANGKKRFPLWEFVENDFSVQNQDAWQWIADYIADSEAILMFNPSDEKSSYKIEGGNNVVKILSEMFNVEFYVTNKNNDYLLSFNHHDILSACGNAKEWLKQYNPQQQD